MFATTISSVAHITLSTYEVGVQVTFSQHFTFTDPYFDTDFTIYGLGKHVGIINIHTECMQGHTSLFEFLATGDLCTSQATRLFKLIPGDIGRPLSDIVTNLTYPNMEIDAEQVLNTLAFSDREIGTTDGRWFQVKIMPYRTLENVIDGVVMTFNDISRAKILEKELRAVGKFPNAEPSSRAAD